MNRLSPRYALPRQLATTLAAALALSAPVVDARTPQTERVVRNLQTTLDNLTLEPAFVAGPIAERDRQTASNLLRDCDYALRRATGDLGRIPAEDKGDPEVQALAQRVAELQAYRDKLAANLQASQAAGAALDAQYRAFREDVKSYRDGLSLFPEVSGASQQMVNVTPEGVKTALDQLAKIDQLCTSKYAGIQFNDRLAFQLAIDPTKVCDAASRRNELATAKIKAIVKADLTRWLGSVIEMKTKLADNQGFLSPAGNVMHDLVFDRGRGKETLLASHRPLLAAVGVTLEPDVLAPFDKALDELWAEIDRLAPTWTFKAPHSDGKTEAGGRKALAGAAKGAKVVKTGMLYAAWDIAKNAIDIPTEKYRTGALLYKVADSKWCVYREFTAHLSYQGGGKYQSTPTYTLGAVRFQACK